MNNEKRVVIKNSVIDFLLALLINLIIFSTNNIIILHLKMIAYSIILLILLYKILIQKKNRLYVNQIKFLYYIFFIFCCCSLLYSKDAHYFFDSIPYYLLGVVIITFNYNKRFFEFLIRICETFVIIFVISMYVESLSGDLFNKLFSWFAVSKTTEVNYVTVSGLAFEKGHAAFICNLGIGIVIGKIMVNSKEKINYIELLLFFVALMMTGKRTLFIIPIIIILIYTLLFSKNNKILKFSGIVLVGMLSILLLSIFVPSAAIVIERMLDNGDDVLMGRGYFWECALEMFKDSPVYGQGFLSFNNYVYEKGFRYYGKKWNYQAHNVYFQLLGETGIVGFSIYTSLLVLLMKKIVYVTCKKKMHWNVTILYWLILYVIYSFTGNTFYYPGQVIILFICITAYSNRVVFE